MAWTATFVADTANLERALGEVEVTLGRVEQDAEKTRRSLQSMTSQFDGSKVSTQAQTMAAAIERVGGVTKLTEAEQRRLNTTVTEAMAKYRALGAEAPAAVQKLSRELQEASRGGTGFVGKLGDIKTAALGAFAGFSAAGLMAGAIGGLKNLASGALETAGMLSDLAAQTGIQASSLDRLRLAAGPAGVELAKITDVATELGVKLTNGDGAVVTGIQRLGLDLNTLKESKPDAAFLAIVEGLLKIPDPMERARAAYGVFGDQGKEVLRLVNTEFLENARTGEAWSEGQIRQLDRASQGWEDFGEKVESVTGGIIADVFEMVESLQTGGGAWAAFMNTPLAGLGAIGQQIAVGKTIPGMKHQGDIGLADDTSGGLVAGVSNFSDVLAEYDRRARAAADARLLNQAGWDAHVARLKAETKAYAELAAMVGGAAQGLASIAATRGTAMGVAEGRLSQNGRITGLANQVSMGGLPSAQTSNGFAWQRPGLNWGSILQGVPSQLVGVFSGGGNLGGGLGSIAGGIGGQALGGMASGLARAGAGLMSGGLTTALGFAGNILPVVGPLLGGLLGKAIGGLFGPSKNAQLTQAANTRIGQTQAGLLDEYGSVDAISRMGPAGNALAAAWGSRGEAGEAWFAKLAADFTRQIEQQNSLLTEQSTTQQQLAELEAQRTALVESLVPKWDTVNGLLDKYGISLEGAGKQVQQLGTTAWFTGLINDMETLERAGIEVGHMLSGMADEISATVQKSIKFGTEIPSNMRPYIERLIASGELLDENGEKITSLAGIKWGAPVKTEADKVKESIQAITDAMQPLTDRLAEIIDMLARLLPAAAAEGARGVADAFDRDYGPRPDSDEPTSSGYAVGGVVTRPRRAWVGEGGQPEIVGPEDFMARVLYRAMARADVGGVGGGAQVVDNRLELDGAVLGRQLITIIPQAARRAGVRLPR